MNDNIIPLFKVTQINDPKTLEADIQIFLDILDESLTTFHQLSVMEKYSLYKTLVEFTHQSMQIYFKEKKQ